jgi:transposase InsO family protein
MVEEQMTAPLVSGVANAVAPRAVAPEPPAAPQAAAIDPAAGTPTLVATPAGGPPAPEHRQRLQEIIQVQAAGRPTSRRDRAAAQQPRRRLEQHVRADAADFYHHLAECGGTLAEAAARLHLLPRTLRQWDYDGRPQQPALSPLGRWPALADLGERSAVRTFLQTEGAAVGVPRLRQAFPDLARAELADLLHDYRQELRQQHTTVRVLHWQVPGRVWAIDFAEPSLLKATWALPPLEGQYPYLLAVRDLASGYQVAWLPLAEASAAQTQAVLAQLFAAHGAPLVLKMDNGPPFRSEETKAFLERAGVLALYSPPACPSYNGSIEAAIGSLKKRTEAHAARQQRSGRWTSADLEAARQEANQRHPPRLNGRTPAQVWAGRVPLGLGEWCRFALAVARQQEQAAQELGLDPSTCLSHWEQSRLDRRAVERALVEHAYLLFTRRRIPLPIMPQKVTSIG